MSALLSAPAAETALAEPTTAAARRRRGSGRWQRVGVRVLATAALLGLWQLLFSLEIWNPVLLPSPGAVWDAFIRTSTTHDDGTVGYQGKLLIEHLAISLGRIVLGSVLGIAGGLVLGVLMGTLPWFRIVVEPLVTFVRALPPLAYFSLLIIWFGIDETPKIWLLAIAAMPPVAVATAAAVVGAPTALVEAGTGARAPGAGRSPRRRPARGAAGDLHRHPARRRHRLLVAWSPPRRSTACPASAAWSATRSATSSTDVVVLGLFAIGLSGLAHRRRPARHRAPRRPLARPRLTSPATSPRTRCVPSGTAAPPRRGPTSHEHAPRLAPTRRRPLPDRPRDRPRGLRRRRLLRPVGTAARSRSASPTRPSPAAT